MRIFHDPDSDTMQDRTRRYSRERDYAHGSYENMMDAYAQAYDFLTDARADAPIIVPDWAPLSPTLIDWREGA